MSETRDVVVVAGARTAIGDFGGALKDVPPIRLGAVVIGEAIRRAGLDPKQIGHVVVGNVIQTEARDMYLARVAAVEAGIGHETPALTLNRLCGSGLQAIVSAAQMIALGDVDIAVAGGAESMSRSAYLLPNHRWGQRMGHGQTVDMLVGALSDPFEDIHMGVTAENVASRFGITREVQDAFAVESHRRAVFAIKEGRFKEQIVPVEAGTRRTRISFDTDEHPRAEANLESMRTLRTVFREDGTVTAGNASGINDAAAAVVLMDRGSAERAGCKPLARLVGYAHAGVDPNIMGIGPVPAVTRLLQKTGLSLAQIDVIESNEAFAAQACAVSQELKLDPAKVNPNGGAISLGHPVGATGCILTIKAIYELQRIQGRYALVTLCIGGGQGIAAIFEREGAFA